MKKIAMLFAALLCVAVGFAIVNGSKIKIWSVQFKPYNVAVSCHKAQAGGNIMVEKGLQKSSKPVFIYEECGDGSVIFRLASDRSLVIAVDGGTACNNADVVLKKYDGSKSQRWYIESSYKATGKFDSYVASALDRKYVWTISEPVFNGEFVRLYENWGGSARQRFTFAEE